MRVVYAVANTTCPGPGGAIVLREGEHWPADDPIVVANPGLFTDDPHVGLRFSQPPIEQATRAPGEKRLVRR